MRQIERATTPMDCMMVVLRVCVDTLSYEYGGVFPGKGKAFNTVGVTCLWSFISGVLAYLQLANIHNAELN